MDVHWLCFELVSCFLYRWECLLLQSLQPAVPAQRKQRPSMPMPRWRERADVAYRGGAVWLPTWVPAEKQNLCQDRWVLSGWKKPPIPSQIPVLGICSFKAVVGVWPFMMFLPLQRTSVCPASTAAVMETVSAASGSVTMTTTAETWVTRKTAVSYRHVILLL